MSLVRKLLCKYNKAAILTVDKEAKLHASYQRQFLGPDGKLNPDAKLIIADLVEQSGLAEVGIVKNSDGTINVEYTLIKLGNRQMVLGVLRRIYVMRGEKARKAPADEMDFQLRTVEHITEEMNA